MTGSGEAVIFSFGGAALLSSVFTASHNTWPLHSGCSGSRCCRWLVGVAFPEAIPFTALGPERTV